MYPAGPCVRLLIETLRPGLHSMLPFCAIAANAGAAASPSTHAAAAIATVSFLLSIIAFLSELKHCERQLPEKATLPFKCHTKRKQRKTKQFTVNCQAIHSGENQAQTKCLAAQKGGRNPKDSHRLRYVTQHPNKLSVPHKIDVIKVATP